MLRRRLASFALPTVCAVALAAAFGAALPSAFAARAYADEAAPTPEETAPVASDSYATYADELVSLQVPSSWEESTYTKNDVTYHVFSGDDASVQVATIPSDYASDAPDVVEAYMKALVGDFETDGAAVGDTTYSSVDGVPIGSYPYVREGADPALTGIVTMVGGADYSSMVISSFSADAPAETIAAVQLIHESVRPVEGAQGSYAQTHNGPAVVLADGAYRPRDQVLLSFAIDDVRYIVPNGEPYLITHASGEPPTIQLSVVIRNAGDDAVAPASLRAEVTGPSGVACDVLSLGEDDTIDLTGSYAELAPGEEVATFFEFSYDGSGVYLVALYEPDEGIDNAVIFTVEV